MPTAPDSSLSNRLARFQRLLPQGVTLTDEEWRSRHRGVLALLAVHAVALPAYAVAAGWEWSHSLTEGGLVIAAITGLAAWGGLPRRARSAVASVGLITASALLTHFSGGYIEAHFHFFVMLGVIALYQDWVPFLLSIGYVAVHHGLMGQLDPGSVFNHPDAVGSPWLWGFIHAFFILCLSVAILVYWKLNEDARARTQLVLDSAGDGIVGVDRRGRVTFANPAAAALAGATPAVLAGKPVAAVLARMDHGPAWSAAGAHGREAWDGALVRADGRRIPVDAVTTRVDDDVQDLGGVVTFKDATARQQAAAMLEAQKEAAEAATRAKSAFLASMSHEIRTPLNAVIGMTSLLDTTQLTDEQREYVQTIRAGGASLLGVINDILDFSKIEAGRMDLESIVFDPRSCVEEAVDLLAPRSREKGLELACLLDPSLPPAIAGDPGRLKQVLVNLLGNAVKFTEHGEVVVTATAKPLGDGRHEVHFAVRDTGIGIAPEKQARLFQMFSQGDTSTTRTHGGTGLGLAICKRLVELMGGKVWVESQPGAGSTFHVTIVAEGAAPITPRVGDGWDVSRMQGLRLLVVDDHATNRRIIEAYTTAWGMRPRIAATPEEALAWIRRGDPFDAAVLDYQMPGMDGLQLAAALRAAPGGRDLPLVLLSSGGATREELAASGAKFSAVLLKPVKQSQLFDAIHDAVEPHLARAPSPQSRALDAAVGRTNPLRVLLAEDNATNQKVALRMLAKMGYQADVAADGQEALEAVLRQPYDLVFMDVEMPRLDGLDAARAICAQLPREGRPRLVAMTAHALVGDREKCLAAGMDDYVTKPVDGAQLAAALHRALQARAPPEAPPVREAGR